MKKLLSLFLCLVVMAVISMSLINCADRKVTATKAAKIMDTALDVALWELCIAASQGSLRRHFGDDVEAIQAWQKLCSTVGVLGDPISPLVEELPGTAPLLVPTTE